MKTSRKGLLVFVALVSVAAMLAGRRYLAGDDASESRPGSPVSAGPAREELEEHEEAEARREADARKQASLDLESQSAQVRARYFEARMQTAQHAIEAQQARIAMLEQALASGPEGSRHPAPDVDAVRAQLSDARARIDARTSQIGQWQKELASLRASAQPH